jgi:hypothetical protein
VLYVTPLAGAPVLEPEANGTKLWLAAFPADCELIEGGDRRSVRITSGVINAVFGGGGHSTW